jgi:hypothetical protein
MPYNISSRVWRHARVGIGRLAPWGGMALGTSEKHHGTVAGDATAVRPQSAAVLSGLRAGGGHTDAVGGPPRVAGRSAALRYGAQLVSTKLRGEVHTRMTRRSGRPHVGQRVANGGGGVRGDGWPARG